MKFFILALLSTGGAAQAARPSVILFDVLGTCVKLRPKLSDAEIRRHVDAVSAVLAGRRPFISLDDIHGHDRKWERLDPWPDGPAGLAELRRHFRIATLSNASVPTLRALSAYAGFTWDEIFSAESAHHYKPDREVYDHAVAQLHLPPAQLMLVASHRYDLSAAQRLGWQTALVDRTGETEADAGEKFDIVVHDLRELARAVDLRDR